LIQISSLEEIDQLLVELSPSSQQAQAVLNYLLQESTVQHSIALKRWDTSRELFGSAYQQLSDEIASISSAFSAIKETNDQLNVLGEHQGKMVEGSEDAHLISASPSPLLVHQIITEASEKGFKSSDMLKKRLRDFYKFGSSLVGELQEDTIRYQGLKVARRSALMQMKGCNSTNVMVS
jgi:hypothetical protein